MEYWKKSKSGLPESGTIVEIRIAKGGCRCGGYQKRECYFDNGTFYGIKNQRMVDYWRISPANDLIKDLEKRQCVVANDCVMCLN